MQQLGHERLLLVVLLAFVLSMQAATSPAATTAWSFGGVPHLVLMPPLSPAVPPTAIAAAQDPAVVEAALDLDRSTRRLIQQGLRNEGFDPGTPDGLFGTRTRAAIRRWQEARGVPPTGHLSATEAELLRGADTVVPNSAAPDLTARDPAQLPARNNPSSAGVEAPRTPEDTRTEPQPDRALLRAATAPAQLPPDILLDSHLLRAEQSMRENDRAGARAAMAQIDALQADHELPTPADYHYRYARIWSAVANWERSQASAVRYIAILGRDGDHYLDALTLMNRATAAIEEIDRARELRAATEARARAAEARARADRERALRAAVVAVEQMEFVPIPPGEFRMGSSNEDSRRYPRTRVRITRAFQVARYEVTQSQWESVVGDNPTGPYFGTCARCPVATGSWGDVQRFLSMVNTAADGDGWLYRLPTEAEWEYAARGGQRGDRLGGDLDASAWFRDTQEGDRHVRPVGSKRPNSFGLYDMFGNVTELTQDWYSHPYPGGTVTDPTGHVSGRYTYRSRYGFRETMTPHKVTRGCDIGSFKDQCDTHDRVLFDVSRDTPYQTGLRLVRVTR